MSAESTALHGAQAIGGGIGLVAAFKFLRWMAEFFFGRMDRRDAALNAREKLLEARYDARLRHVETELKLYRKATMMLVNALAKANPTDPALASVASILATAVPIEESDADLDALLQQAAESLERRRSTRSNETPGKFE